METSFFEDKQKRTVYKWRIILPTYFMKLQDVNPVL